MCVNSLVAFIVARNSYYTFDEALRWSHLPSAAHVCSCRIITPAKSWRVQAECVFEPPACAGATRIARPCAAAVGVQVLHRAFTGHPDRGDSPRVIFQQGRARPAKCLHEPRGLPSPCGLDHGRDPGHASGGGHVHGSMGRAVVNQRR